MLYLSKREEQILLAIIELDDNAYLVAIKKYLSKILGKNWTIGAIYKPLSKLESLGLIEASWGESTEKRGGRKKKIYRVTAEGIEVLSEIKKQNDLFWSSFARLEFRRD